MRHLDPAGPFSLAPGAAHDFSCTFTVNSTVNWSADGQGTDSLGSPVPADGEHQQGSVAPAALTIVKKTNGTDNQCPTVAVGSTVTWTYAVTNTGAVPDQHRGHRRQPARRQHGLHFGYPNSHRLAGTGRDGDLTATGPATAGAYIQRRHTATASPYGPGITVPLTASDDDCYSGHPHQSASSRRPTAPTTTARPGPRPGRLDRHLDVQRHQPGQRPAANVTVTDDNGTPGDTADDVTVGTIATLARTRRSPTPARPRPAHSEHRHCQRQRDESLRPPSRSVPASPTATSARLIRSGPRSTTRPTDNANTKVATGTVVHDKVFVARPPTPRQRSRTRPAASSSTATPPATAPARRSTRRSASPPTAPPRSAAVTATADLSYRADYAGDANYPARDGACEPLDVIHPATSLTVVGTPVTTVKSGDVVTIALNEKNTGDDPITGVHLTGGSAGGTTNCTWAPTNAAFNGNLAPGQSQDFSCTFTVGTAAISWKALGQGTEFARQRCPRRRRKTRGHAGDRGRQPDRRDRRLRQHQPRIRPGRHRDPDARV